MASNSEASFGARLENAGQLAGVVGGFDTYEPVSELSQLDPFNALTASIHTNNDAIAVKRAQFRAAVERRQNIFTKTPESLAKRLSPIGSYIKAKFGKESSQFDSVSALIKKIRGVPGNVKRSETGEFVSQSQQSFGSKTENFDSLRAILGSYGGEYAPSNASINIATLTTLSTTLHTDNMAVTTAWVELKPLLDLRLVQYDDLNNRAQKIKDAVKSQYGIKSSEYVLIKSYKI